MGGITTIINKVKYVGIACLSLAILSTLILNIISSYSLSKIESNAMDSNSEVSTLANDSSICNPTNTNAAACISLSITSSSSSTGGNDANLSLSIPQGGGIATGRHTVTVNTNSVGGYKLSYLAQDKEAKEDNALINTINSSYRIEPNEVDLDNYIAYPLNNNRWGMAIIPPSNVTFVIHPFSDEQAYLDNDPKATYAPVFTKSTIEQDNLLSISPSSPSAATGDAFRFYYGVRVDNPSELLAGDYQTEVVYTATVKLPPAPTNLSVQPNTYELGSGESGQVTINGANLKSVYEVYLTNSNGDKVGDCTNLSVADDTQLTCTVPTDQTNPDLEPGDYTIHVVTQGGEGTIGFTYNESKTNSVAVDYGDGIGHVQVDYDKNMIPVYYNGSQWMSLRDSMIKANPSIWFDYTGNSTNGDGSHWANAVTVKKEALSKYQNKNLPIDESDVLGYWVYIPRYAYRVMRRDVTDKVVTDEEAIGMGGFSIRFETKDDFKKTPVQCAISTTMSYLDCVDPVYPREERLANQTAWATHPAFSWGTESTGYTELNGFWIGKFETTGTKGSPTVLPNQYHQYPSSIGDMYDVAKSMGAEDPNNKYGNTKSTNQANQNNNNLAISTSHMLKNSEWGAVVYLSASKYGAGVNNVQLNNSYSSGGTGKGPSGGAYNTADGQKASTTNNIYGVYDMAGGAWEYVMGGYTTDASQSMTNDYLSFAVKPPYVDLYVDPPFSGTFYTNNNLCTWTTCGGHALYETKNVQSVLSYNQSWGGDYSYFVISSTPWFLRGGSALYYGSNAGLFYSDSSNGSTDYYYGFRVALLP